MTLTQAQVAQLTAPFEAHEHRFISGNAYVDEYAVCQRLSQIDPSWEFVRIEESRTDIRAKVWMRLTIAGVTRDGVGMSPLTRKKRDGTIMDIDEPEKNAATDALRRAARLFGIGQYLLLLPKDDKGNPTVTNTAQMEGWLKRQFGTVSQIPPKATQQAQGQAPQPEPIPTTANVQNGAQNADLEPIPFVSPGEKQWWPTFWKYVTPLYDNPAHAQNSVKKMVSEKQIDASQQAVAIAIEAVKKHVAEKRLS